MNGSGFKKSLKKTSCSRFWCFSRLITFLARHHGSETRNAGFPRHSKSVAAPLIGAVWRNSFPLLLPDPPDLDGTEFDPPALCRTDRVKPAYRHPDQA